MGHANGNITAPVNTDDVSSVLGVSSHDVATLCTHEKVNKWSKHKPVRGESPADYDTWTRDTGNIRATSGYPIRWGMELPFNTQQQLNISSITTGLKWLKPLAWRAAHRTNATSEGNVRNYVYKKPVLGTDFCRLTDFVGYWHTATEAWSVGVAGATDKGTQPNYDGSTGTDLAVDTFDTSTLDFYIGTTVDADIKFHDIFDIQGYRFFIELYLNDASVSSDSDVPNAVIVSTQDLTALGTWGIRFSIPVGTVATKCGITYGTGVQKIVAVLGVNRFGDVPPLTEEKTQDNKGLGYAWLSSTYYNTIAEGVGSIPPWSKTHKPFICDIEFRSYSKISLWPTKYAKPAATETYYDMPTTAKSLGADGIKFKMTVHNKGTTAFTFNNPQNKFQIQARGNFKTSDPSYEAMCLNPFEGKWKEAKFYTDPDCTNASQVTVNGGTYKYDIYMECRGFIPIGEVNAFTMRVSTDGGVNYVITASFSGLFIVP